MHQSHPSAKHFLLCASISLSALLIWGCCSPGTYYQPVTYVPQSPCYGPTYSYPSYSACQPVVVPLPRYAWSPPWTPPPTCHRDAIFPQGCSWQARRAAYDHHREEHRATSWAQRQQNVAQFAPDRNTPARSYQALDQPPSQSAHGDALQQQQFTLASNQYRTIR